MAVKQQIKSKEKKVETHVSEAKKKTVLDLAKLMKEKNTTLLVSIEGIPSSMFNILKRRLKGFDVQTKVVKKHLVKLALEKVKADKAEIAQLEELLKENIAVLLSDKDAYEIASFLEGYKEPAKAKPGQIAPTDLIVEAGPTDLPAGPAISELAKVKLKAGI
jgi:large subunit ribosomal protein L10